MNNVQIIIINKHSFLYRFNDIYLSVKNNSIHVMHVITFFPSLKTNQPKVALFSILRKISCQDDFFHTPVSFSVFHCHFQFVSFFSWGLAMIESQQRHFEESVIIGVERTWPIKHLLSNHESFIPNHVGPLISSDFFLQMTMYQEIRF